jgi:hypothetical protein
LERGKKTVYQEEMGIFEISILFLTIITLGGGLLETYVPQIFSEAFKKNMTALTVGFLGITVSTFLLMIFLKRGNREGFQDQSQAARWTIMANGFKVSEVCKLYSEMYEKILLVEKGAPPEPVKTDAQAREAVDKIFGVVMKVPPLSCSLFEEVESQKENMDSFFKIIQKVPDNFFVQVVQTAQACLFLLVQQYQKVLENEKRQKEGFEDFNVCTDQAIAERKAFQERKPLSQEAQTCLLPEEITPEKKEDAIRKKLDAIVATYQSYIKENPMKNSMDDILKSAAFYKGELDKRAKEAEETSNKYKFR